MWAIGDDIYDIMFMIKITLPCFFANNQIS